MDEVEDGQKHNKRDEKRANDSDDEESGEVGPKTPPDGEEMVFCLIYKKIYLS
jgi:hypothetical protein